ncbi:MAG: SNF2-related protein [Nitriliruptoraceae bacterium]
MLGSAQLTFVPAGPTPAASGFALWTVGDHAPDDVAQSLGLARGRAWRMPTVRVDGSPVDGGAGVARLVDVEVDSRRVDLLAALRWLAGLAADRPTSGRVRLSDSVHAWSVAAKLALELVAAGHLVPTITSDPTIDRGIASWRAAARADDRISQLAAAMPPAAHALRRGSDQVWTAEDLLASFLDAVADSCARQGRRPEVDRRGRVAAATFAESWLAALTGADPVVDRVGDVDAVSRDVADWTRPVVGHERASVARIGLRVSAPEHPDAPDRDPWTVHLHLEAVDGDGARLDADDVWSATSATVEIGGHVVDAPRVVLLRGLATAARLFAPLDRSLDVEHPSAQTLDDAEVADLLAHGIDNLATAGVRVELPTDLRAGAPRLRMRLRVGRVPAASDDAVAAGIGGLAELRHELAVGDESVDEDEFARIVARRAPLVRWRGRWVLVDDDVVEAGRSAGQSISVTLTEALAAVLAGRHHTRETGWVEARAGTEFTDLVQRLASGERRDARIPEAFTGTLRPYQRRGVAWLQGLAELGMGAVLADDMGLGKTVQAIALLGTRPADRPHLVVCPTSVVGNWTRELHRFMPDLAVTTHHGPERTVRRSAMQPGRVVVTSYALLRRDESMLTSIDWDTVVFDEAQQLKNPASVTTRTARRIDGRLRIAMTGTPVENRLSELWSIMEIVNPGLLGSRRRFDEHFAVPIERWNDHEASDGLRRLIGPFVLRRRKSDTEVAVDLPPKQQVEASCGLTTEQAGLYRAATERAFAGDGLGTGTFERRGRVLALLTALKQICNHPAQYLGEDGPIAGRSGKLRRFGRIVTEVVDSGERLLVFTQFRRMGDLLVTHLDADLGIGKVDFLHGGVSLADRDLMVDRFQHDPDAPHALVVSLRAGGTGLNLTRATHVVHYDRWWNPAVEDQATDRAHRIGQHRSVSVHTMVTTGTVEERIGALLERKRALADTVIGTDETWLTDLDDDELSALVSLSADALEDLDDLDEESDDPPPTGGDEPSDARPRLTVVTGGRT